MYYRPETQQVFTTHSEVRSGMLHVLFPEAIDEEMLEYHGVFQVISERPVIGSHEIAEPAAIEIVEGEWTQLWTVRDATPEELDAMKPLAPTEVSMRQARLALLGIGKLDQVASAIESLDSAERDAARIEWEFSSTVLRDRPLVKMLGNALGLNDQALDQLFITAAEL